MDLTSDDKHNMQLNPEYIPSPAMNERFSSGFHVPISMDIAYDWSGHATHAIPYGIFTDSVRSLRMESSSLFYLTATGSLFISIISMRRIWQYDGGDPSNVLTARSLEEIFSLPLTKPGDLWPRALRRK
jgi:hypothetical protein